MSDRIVYCGCSTEQVQKESQVVFVGNYDDGIVFVHVDQQSYCTSVVCIRPVADFARLSDE